MLHPAHCGAHPIRRHEVALQVSKQVAIVQLHGAQHRHKVGMQALAGGLRPRLHLRPGRRLDAPQRGGQPARGAGGCAGRRRVHGHLRGRAGEALPQFGR